MGTLSLDGDAGRLHLTVISGTSGANAEHHAARYGEIRKLAQVTPEPEETLRLAAGDWNFVMSQNDRNHAPEQTFTGLKDKPEADLFRKSLGAMKGWHEVEQDHYTHFQTGCRVYSLIDRAYTNQFATDQLDRFNNCALYPWCQKTIITQSAPFFKIRPQ